MIAAFYAIGIIVPSFTYQIEIEVDASLEKTWNTYVSEETKKEWMFDLKEVKLKSGKPFEIGSISEYEFLQNGEKIVVSETLTEIEMYRIFAYTLNSEVLTQKSRIEFRENGPNRSILISSTEVKARGLFLKSLFAVINRTFSNQAELQYMELKKVIES